MRRSQGIDFLDPNEDSNRYFVPQLILRRTQQAHLPHEALGAGFCLLEVSQKRQAGVLLALIPKSKLERKISIALLGLDLEHLARSGLDHRHAQAVSLFIEDLRHADLAPKNTRSFRHDGTPPEWNGAYYPDADGSQTRSMSKGLFHPLEHFKNLRAVGHPRLSAVAGDLECGGGDGETDGIRDDQI